MTFDELAKAIHEVKSRTDNPFGVNLRSDQPDVDDRIALLVREGVKVASFAQAPGERLVKLLKDAGVVVMPTVGARRHAEKVASWGVDAVIAQGAEGGGHTGTVPTSLLLPQVCDAVDIPVLARGRVPRRPRARRRARVRRGRRRDGHALPALRGEHRARRGEAPATSRRR